MLCLSLKLTKIWIPLMLCRIETIIFIVTLFQSVVVITSSNWLKRLFIPGKLPLFQTILNCSEYYSFDSFCPLSIQPIVWGNQGFFVSHFSHQVVSRWAPHWVTLSFRYLRFTLRLFCSNLTVYSIPNEWKFKKSASEPYRCLNLALVIPIPKPIPYL